MQMTKEERLKLALNARTNDMYEIKLFTKVNFFNEVIKKYSSQKIGDIIHSELKSNGLEFTVSNLVTPNISEDSYYYVSLLEMFLTIMENYILLFQIRTWFYFLRILVYTIKLLI